MVPRIWQLGLFETNEVYLNESIQDTLTVILEEADFIQGQDFRFELARTYRKWPFRLQYNETHLDDLIANVLMDLLLWIIECVALVLNNSLCSLLDKSDGLCIQFLSWCQTEY